MMVAAAVAAGAVAEGEGSEPEPGLSKLHIFSGFRHVNDESGIDIMNRDFGPGLVLTWLDGDEDGVAGRLGGDVGVGVARRRLQREDDAVSKTPLNLLK